MNEPSAGSSCFVSGWCPVRTPECTARIEIKRANTWAVVMNSSVDASGAETTASSALAELRESSTKLLCVSTQPFGRPVEPDV